MTAGRSYAALVADGQYELELERELAGFQLAPRDVRESSAAAEAWSAALTAVAERIPAASYRTWIEPLKLLGERRGAVCVAGRRRIASWVRRRYAPMLGDAVRDAGMRGIYVYDAPPEREGIRCQ